MSKSKEAIVVYYSRDGNTRRVANIISKYLKCRSLYFLEIDDISPYNLVAIGSPVYSFAPVPVIVEWIKSQDFMNKKVVLFCTFTWWGEQRTLKIMKNLVERRNGKVIGFHATVARHKFIKRDRPNSEDLKKVEIFAKDIYRRWKSN
jgi:flavodoxin